jgi:S1-C subfamily serine protease
MEGLVVTAVEATSPYGRYLRPGTVILEINDREVTSLENAREQLRRGVNKFYVYDRGRTGYLAFGLE